MAPWTTSKFGANQSKSMLRDCMNRLRHIRQKCGKDDPDNPEGGEKTGDPFRDKIVHFSSLGKQVKEMIEERNTNQQRNNGTEADLARDSHDVNSYLSEMHKELKDIQAMVAKSDKDLAKANRKKKKPEKIAILEKSVRERQMALDNCQRLYEQLRDLNSQRYLSAKEAKEAALNKDNRIRASERLNLRQSLSSRLQQGKKRKAEGDNDDDADGGEVDSRRLDTDAETKDAVARINKKEQKMNEGLTRVQATLGRIIDISENIRDELDRQQKALDQADDKVDKATKDLKLINKGLTKLLKEQRPMNIIINVLCFILLLALVGMFLFEFKVV